jgi:hypothetical protein
LKSFINTHAVYLVVSNKAGLPLLTLIMLILPLVVLSGCIDVHSTRDVFFPRDEKQIEYIQGTIAEVRHNFTGGFGDSVEVLTQEEHFSVDNFFIGEGGGDLYIFGQVVFGADTERRVEYQRTIEISLYYMSEEEGAMLKVHKIYHSPPTGMSDAGIIGQIEDAEHGLWSLQVIGNGTASTTADVPFSDWYHVTVNGRYSDDSYNHNAPHSSRDN